MVKNISTKGSMEGWDVKVWLKRNKENLKLILSGVVGIATFFVSGLPGVWSGALGVIVVGLSKLALDSLDFYTSEVKLE